MYEIQKPTHESTAKYEDHAKDYARKASIELEPCQKAQYAELRGIEVDPVYYSKYGPGLWSLSDFQLLYLTLRPEQQTVYENKYGQVDFVQALECYFKWCEYKYPEIEIISMSDNTPIIETLSA